MNRLFALTALAATAMTGCVIYEDSACGSCGWGCNDEGEDCQYNDDGWETDDEGEAAYDVVLTMDPDTATAGEVVIGSITIVDGELDFEAVVDVHVYGEADILATDSRDDELLVTLVVSEEAAVGSIDFVLEMEDGGAVWFEDALYVYEVGDGGDDGNGNGDDGNGGDDTGAGDDSACE